MLVKELYYVAIYLPMIGERRINIISYMVSNRYDSPTIGSRKTLNLTNLIPTTLIQI